jgi:hypothetical protein
MFLNYPPILRNLLECIWLFGILPPHVKDYQQMLLPLVDQLAKYQPGPLGEDLTVYDADLEAETSHRLIMAFVLNDIRAVPSGTCGKHPPAYVGSCNFCKQVGRNTDRMVLGGAVRALGTGTSRAQACMRRTTYV